MDKPRIVVLCCDGIYQRYLVQRLATAYEVVGVVLHAVPNEKGSLWNRARKYLSPMALWRYLMARRELARANEEARGLLEALFFTEGQPPTIPEGTPKIAVANINDADAVSFVRGLHPDIVCVNGTNLLREPMLSLFRSIPLGFVNLHTGLSPYARGGNCNLYVLLEGRPELVGVTVHHIDPGIDSGDIIITAQVDMAPDDTFEKIDIKTFRLGIDLMVTAVRQLVEGRAERVEQWEEGRLYLRRTGYVYEPYQRVTVNRLIGQGLLARYLSSKTERDAAVRLVGKRT